MSNHSNVYSLQLYCTSTLLDCICIDIEEDEESELTLVLMPN